MARTTRVSAWTAAAAGVLSIVAWLLVAVVGATPARAHHGKHSSGAAAAAAAGQPSTPTPAPATAAAPAPPPSSPAPSPSASAAATSGPVTGEVGATGENVRLIEERLEALRYPVGTVDSTYDQDTAYAVMGFQKVNGLERTGKVTPEVWAAMGTATTPQPLVPGGGERRVEIDLARQALFLYEGNQLSKIVGISSGTEKRYCENGHCGDAVTPRGDFKVYRQGRGWEYGPLGGLYNPAYFVGGVALHGSRSVPATPASHGCVRVPMSVAEWLPDRIPLGTPVYVR